MKRAPTPADLRAEALAGPERERIAARHEQLQAFYATGGSCSHCCGGAMHDNREPYNGCRKCAP